MQIFINSYNFGKLCYNKIYKLIRNCIKLYINIYKRRLIILKIKILLSLDDKKFEERVNHFLEENKDKIEVIEIQWKIFIYHYAMIIYKEI